MAEDPRTIGLRLREQFDGDPHRAAEELGLEVERRTGFDDVSMIYTLAHDEAPACVAIADHLDMAAAARCVAAAVGHFVLGHRSLHGYIYTTSHDPPVGALEEARQARAFALVFLGLAGDEARQRAEGHGRIEGGQR